MRLPCKNRQVYLHRLFSKALEAAHLRFKRLMERVLIIYRPPVLKAAEQR